MHGSPRSTTSLKSSSSDWVFLASDNSLTRRMEQQFAQIQPPVLARPLIASMPARWKTVSLHDILTDVGNGLTKEQNKEGEGYPVTRIETISQDSIDEESLGFVTWRFRHRVRQIPSLAR